MSLDPGDVVLVRHARPVVIPDLPAAEWALHPDAHGAAGTLGRHLVGVASAVAASSERKAIETATALDLGDVVVDAGLVEVGKPWYPEAGDHHAAAALYLAGERLAGWEPVDEVLDRFGAALAAVTATSATSTTSGGTATAVVTHGTVMTLWLQSTVGLVDPYRFWLDLRMPDAWHVVDSELRRVGPTA